MRLTITATNSKISLECSYIGFYKLRQGIANALNEEFGIAYKDFIFSNLCDKTEQDIQISRLNTIISNNLADDKYNDILEFLFVTDYEGKIPYQMCKNIYDIIKDMDLQINFQYTIYVNGNDFELFKQLLLECYSRRKKLRWS